MGRLNKSLFAIVSQREVAPRSFLLQLEGDTSAITGSGQFVQVALPGRYLRRPISVCNVTVPQASNPIGRLTLLYKIMGAGTDQMAAMRPGDTLELLTGLGNGFDTSACREKALLVGGGMGVAPLYLLAQELLAQGKQVQVILGFNQASEICLEEEFRALGSGLNTLSDADAKESPSSSACLDVIVSTVDGSRGVKGFVTDAIKTLAGPASTPYDYFYTCGPMVMMKAVCALCPTDGQASLEERMDCGFGICYGCTVATQDGPRRVCADGPVFTKTQLGW
ncbi:MAG: dihydroorotate dehydrogenase electron transfer subunit [Bacteroidales bacterium]|nr:dihydroorotate dehydrogenase electron transfer subunit [Bacteroidales bacterium]